MESKVTTGLASFGAVDWKSIISKGEAWTDDKFPPTYDSLFNPSDYEADEPPKYTGLEWKRASELFPDGFSIVPDELDPEQINQGMIGDCYFLSCLSALAANGERIKKLFLTKEPNSAGCYVMMLHVGGLPHSVVVDDYLPSQNGRLVFGSSGDNSIWVALLEKAWAKLHGNYCRIINGTVDMGYIHLCGMPSIAYKHKEWLHRKDQLWAYLNQAC